MALWIGLVFGALSNPQRPGRGHDEFVMLYGHITMVNYLESGLPIVDSPLASSMRKPHLPYALSAWIHRYWPTGYAAPLLANALFAALGWLVVYLVGARVFGPWTALAGVCVLGGLDLSIDLTEHFGNDVPVALFAAAGIGLLLEPRRFVSLWRWPALGLVVGLGLLSKPTLPVYIAGPALLLVARLGSVFTLSRNRAYLAASIAGLFVTLGVLTIVWLPWFARVWDVMLLHADDVVRGPGRDFAWFHSIDGDTAPADALKFLGPWGAAFVGFGIACIPFGLTDARRRTLAFAFAPAFLLFVVVTEAFTRLLFPLWFIPVLFGMDRLMRLKGSKAAPVVAGGVAGFFTILMILAHLETGWMPYPKLDATNRAYSLSEPVEALGVGCEADGTDALFVNRASWTEGPDFYYDVMRLQSARCIRHVHMWDPRPADLSTSIVTDLLPRWDKLEYVIDRRAPDVSTPPWDAVGAAKAQSWEYMLPGDRKAHPLHGFGDPEWRLVGSSPAPPGAPPATFDVYRRARAAP